MASCNIFQLQVCHGQAFQHAAGHGNRKLWIQSIPQKSKLGKVDCMPQHT